MGSARDWRLPKALAIREALAVIVDSDGFALLSVVDAAEAPSWLREVLAAQTLRRLWLQQYLPRPAAPALAQQERAAPGALAIGSPYDAEARYGTKAGVGWRG